MIFSRPSILKWKAMTEIYNERLQIVQCTYRVSPRLKKLRFYLIRGRKSDTVTIQNTIIFVVFTHSDATESCFMV